MPKGDQRAILLAQIAGEQRRRNRLTKQLAECDAERLALYRDARALDPPIPWTEIGRAAGLSGEAIQKTITRAGAA